ncbi:unnamed protein product [Urochloa decumbens]|uniref:Receptor kinase-like protein Xa21 n=1 Tax=Urochloa decumbens TaxID=240449 RepID=A0ABC8ZB22_9POAL
MAMRLVSLLQLLLSTSIFFSILAVAASKDAGDAAALLAFKAAAISGRNGGEDPLASWNRSNAAGLCSWYGVTCGARHGRVVAVRLVSRKLTGGVLSCAIGNLSFLRTLDLSYNGLTGEIPASIGRLRRLRSLNLSHNAFSGEIPSNISFCTSLTAMRLRVNQLRGSVPSNLGHKLTNLDLRYNDLTGVIPPSLANLSSLDELDLSINRLEGAIPPGLGRIQALHFLDLALNNLSGEPPISLYNLSSLLGLQIQGNMLHGGIPTDIGSKFPNLIILGFGKNLFTGSIPASISNLTTLEDLELSRNRFNGHVPPTLGRLRALQALYLYNNTLEADDTEGWEFITSLSNCSQLQKLFISNNSAFTGRMPSSIVNLSTTLLNLVVGYSGITGSIPSAIGNLVNLEWLEMASTFISGMMPESIGKLRNLALLDLSDTHLSGLIPSSIGNLTKLTILEADGGNLEGPIPASIGNLDSLLALDLSMNRLNSSIPKDMFKLPVISVYLNLAHNSLSGLLPSEVGKLGNLNQLVLSGNQLSGEIPDTIGDCTVLQLLWLDNNSFKGTIPQSLKNIKGLNALNLSMNNLSGSIPGGIATIHNLQELYLAHNYLSGLIPASLQNLTSLSKLDLSFNNLQGEVPKLGIFTNFSNFLITGNNELCGGIPQLHLAPCHTNSVTRSKKGKLNSLTVALATIGALVFSTLVISLILLTYKKLTRRLKTPLQTPTMKELYGRISYQELSDGTHGFSEANLLGKGSFGAVYKCTFEDDETAVAVKVFNLELSGSTRSFEAECDALRSFRHRCLIKIITCCSSINHQGQDFKALVFEFMQNGSLNDWLHPKSSVPSPTNTLSLEQRLDITVDILDALDYLHNYCQPPIVHCDLKPSNILLAEDMSARVGDFGISRILPEGASVTLQNSNSTIGIRGSIGYIAPEYGEGFSISTVGDVYSLGILLLEMFTGRRPTDDMFIGSMDLHKFSEDALPDRIWGITDTTIWLHIDADDSTTRRRIENCLVSVIALGISCSKKEPRERTLIQDAATKMRAIRDSYKKITEVEDKVETTLQ